MVLVGLLTLPLSLLALSWLVRFINRILNKTEVPWSAALLHSACVWLLTLAFGFALRPFGYVGEFIFIAGWFVIHGGTAGKLLSGRVLDVLGEKIGVFQAVKVGVLAGAALFIFAALIAWFASKVG
jgi:hypothetical protein